MKSARIPLAALAACTLAAQGAFPAQQVTETDTARYRKIIVENNISATE